RQASAARLSRESGLGAAQVERLLGRYGDGIDDVLALVAERPELGRELAGAEPYLGAEVVHACTHEGALHLDDVLARRTRIAFEVRDGGLAAAPPIAALMGGELGWDGARVAR